ncbi:MAG: LPS biosynthesis protein [Acidimicrobiaceae bacterium]|nr:LPS biosynthesis protein [Acidimicrobiaceae bacterium]
MIKHCSNCLYKTDTDMQLYFDEFGRCTGCQNAEIAKKEINWEERLEKLKELFKKNKKSNSKYDVLIGVSGGKDSYFQAHLCKKILGLNPLLVTYYGNNYTEEGEYNLRRMKKIFDCDHIIFKPDTDILIKMNLLGFYIQGDMNWHNHCGIMTYPFQIAVKENINFILWGEHGYMDRAGMFFYEDYVEFTKRHRKEHDLRGYDWYDFTDTGLKKNNKSDLIMGLKDEDLSWAQYPEDEEIDRVGLRGIYAQNYVFWDGNNNAKISQELYGWQKYKSEFQRTYRKISNLDDMHENGAHDYLKFIKFGYGRGSDHSTKDIRLGYMKKEEGIEMVKKYDHVKPTEDLNRWLKYVGMNETDFDKIADTFRDPRTWYIKNNLWFKENLWGGESSYGEVFLEKKDRFKFER